MFPRCEQELSDASPLNKPLRRRVVRLVSQWVARLHNEDRPALYQALMQVMAEKDRCMQVRGGKGHEGGGGFNTSKAGESGLLRCRCCSLAAWDPVPARALPLLHVSALSGAACPTQLTAVDAMRTLVDDWNFSDEQFVGFVGPCMERLLFYAADSDELETQTHVGGMLCSL